MFAASKNYWQNRFNKWVPSMKMVRIRRFPFFIENIIVNFILFSVLSVQRYDIQKDTNNKIMICFYFHCLIFVIFSPPYSMISFVILLLFWGHYFLSLLLSCGPVLGQSPPEEVSHRHYMKIVRTYMYILMHSTGQSK